MEQNFITNTEAKTLKKRIIQLISHSKELKFLVGFFYFSGWRVLYESIRERDDLTIKILVGLDVENFLGQTVEVPKKNKEKTNNEITDQFFLSLESALNTIELDKKEFYEQAYFFLDLLESGKLHIRKTVNPNHAKLYLFCVKDELKTLISGDAQNLNVGKFITGSSNLTYSGLHGQDEFNVEIGDYGWEEAEHYFDELWEMSVPITDDLQHRTDLANIVRNRSQVARVKPFEAYALVLKTYIDLMSQKQIKPHVVRLLEESGYQQYKYQADAVNQALSVIGEYNGVIIADVVGLGKSVIASMLARQLGKRGMVICPPGLIGDRSADSGWKKYLHDFHLYDWEVWSTGLLEDAANYLKSYGDDIEVIIIDEAHRFRNEDTESYEWLSTICRNRKVILLTATPFSNRPSDIFALLKLFIIPGKSLITLDENLEARFSHYNNDFRRLSYIMRYHDAGGDKQKRAEGYYLKIFEDGLPIDLNRVRIRSGRLADRIRSVIEPVLIRRNRLDLKNDPVYKEEVDQLSNVNDPKELFFELTKEQSRFYNEVTHAYFGETGRFKGAIYQPFTYEKARDFEEGDLDDIENRAFQQQRNLYNFMRRLIVKRFESSFGAFKQTIENFIDLHIHVLEFIEKSDGKYVLDRKLIEKIYEEDPEEIQEALDDFSQQLSEQKKTPKHDRIYSIPDFELAGEFLQHIKSDLALLREVQKRIDDLELVERNLEDKHINDPKAKRLVEVIDDIVYSSNKNNEPKRRVVIFTEYVDTVLYIKPILEQAFSRRVLDIPGRISKTAYRQLLSNFDASVDEENQNDKFDILLTSDKLSEGVNLNRAGVVINYDIPWNPTRVIQRVGRINRIGHKVFENLHIYNFFPTEKGSDIIKSREIAEQKLFIIHNTLGEDAKIFDVDEEPTPSELYKRINQNPEQAETESTLTYARREYNNIAAEHPELVERISKYPPRVKTAKKASSNQLAIFRRKGLGFFIHGIESYKPEPLDIRSLLFEEALPWISCSPDEPRRELSKNFWLAYQSLKNYKEERHETKSEISIEVRALNNLQSSLRHYREELASYIPFIRLLKRDIRDYKTLPKFSLRRLAGVDLKPNNADALELFKEEIDFLRGYLGEDYLDKIDENLGSLDSEIIIAVENQEERV